MIAKDFFLPEDEAYVIGLRREIHQKPEIGFDLPNTLAVVKRELDALEISYTEKYGKSSVVATIGGQNGGPTLGFRADMDALPVEEKTGVPYASQFPGVMHACGHDAHTAMLLGAARALKRAESALPCTVKLLFQPSEEGAESGAAHMVADGVMDDIDWILALHVGPLVPTGVLGLRAGNFMAACHPYTIEFFGASVHATIPEDGCDALAMAVKAYNNIYLMKCREIGPFRNHILSISCLEAGQVHNVIADYAKMLISFRFYEMDLHDKVDSRIRQICENAAAELGGTCRISGGISAYPVINDAGVIETVRKAAEHIGCPVTEHPMGASSEDFSHYLLKKPGAFVRLGTRNETLGYTKMAHASDFMLDEAALIRGSELFVQVALDQQSAE